MYNWSVDTERLKKNPDKYQRFILEQQINFGLNGIKLSRTDLEKHWHTIEIDPQKRTFLKKLLWPQS